MRRTIASVVAAGTVGVVGIVGSAALVLAPAGPAVADQAKAAAGAFVVDPVHSTAVFRVGHLGIAAMWGNFNEPTGSFTIDLANPSASVIDISVSAEKVDTANEGRDRHLKSPDFFNAKQFPTLSFVSKSFEKTGEGTFSVSGELTMLGVTKPVSLVLTYLGEGETRQGYKAGFEAKLTIKRSDFGMTFGLPLVADRVRLLIQVEGLREP